MQEHHPETIAETIADDRLVGADAIARFRGEQPRKTRYLIDKGLLPVGREGNLIVASKRDHWRRTTEDRRPK